MIAASPLSSPSSSHLLRDKAFRRCYSLPPLRPARTSHVPSFSTTCAAAPDRERERTADSYHYHSRSYSAAGGAAGATAYDVLGLTAAATPQEIKAAYRRLARACHPDAAASTGRKKGASADEFMRVHAAYATLSEPSKRAEYDRRRFVVPRPPDPSFNSCAAGPGGSYYSPPSPASTSHSSPSSSFGRRTWETDQCW